MFFTFVNPKDIPDKYYPCIVHVDYPPYWGCQVDSQEELLAVLISIRNESNQHGAAQRKCVALSTRKKIYYPIIFYIVRYKENKDSPGEQMSLCWACKHYIMCLHKDFNGPCNFKGRI